MRYTEISVLLIVAVLMGLGLLCVFTALAGAVAAYWVSISALGLFVVHVLLTSVYVLDADQMLVSIFFGTIDPDAYVSGTYAQQEGLGRGGQSGLLGTDVVILLWPIFRARIVPTTPLQLRVPVALTYPFDEPGGNRAPTDVYLTLTLYLAPRLAKFVLTFKLLQEGINLARKDKVYDALWKATDPDDKREEHEYDAPMLTWVLLRQLEVLIQESMKWVVSHYAWRGDDEAHPPIHGNTPQLQDELLRQLSVGESMFVKGGLLMELPRDAQGEPVGEPVWGPAARTGDLNVGLVVLASPQAQESLSEPIIAEQRARATVIQAGAQKTQEKLVREGKGEGIAAMAAATGIPTDTIYLGEVLGTIDNVTLLSGSETVTDIARAYVASRLPGQNQPPRQLPPPNPGGNP